MTEMSENEKVSEAARNGEDYGADSIKVVNDALGALRAKVG